MGGAFNCRSSHDFIIQTTVDLLTAWCGMYVQEPVIGGMERAVEKVRKERADLLLARRRQDITDMDNECAQTDSG